MEKNLGTLEITDDEELVWSRIEDGVHKTTPLTWHELVTLSNYLAEICPSRGEYLANKAKINEILKILGKMNQRYWEYL